MTILLISVIEKIDNFFNRLFNRLSDSFSLGTLGVLLIGVILGFLICATIYGLLMMVALKNEEKVRKDKKLNVSPDMDKLSCSLKEIKQKFLDNTEGLTSKERFQYLGPTILETINTIAYEYYPESKYPLYELTVDELIMLLGYISNRVNDIFKKPILKPFKRMTISQVFKVIDLQKQVNENKAVKAANRLKLNVISKALLTAVNMVNPVYWFNKLIKGTTINIAVRSICLRIIDIVGEETNNTYSKAIFRKETQLPIIEVDEEYQGMKGEQIDE